MAIFTLTIECSSRDELTDIVSRLNQPREVLQASPAPESIPFPVEIPEEPAPEELTQVAAAPETPPPAKRGRPKKADLKPGEPKLNGNGETHLPDLDVLKNAVVAAVKAARVPGGNGAVLDLLPEFKEKTGLQFVMDAKDEHRPALLELIQKAGLELA